MERKDLKVKIGKGESQREVPATKRVWAEADFPEWNDSPYVAEIDIATLVKHLNYAEDLKVRARVRGAADQEHTEEMRSQAMDWALVNDIAGFKATKGNAKALTAYLNKVWDERLAAEPEANDATEVEA